MAIPMYATAGALKILNVRSKSSQGELHTAPAITMREAEALKAKLELTDTEMVRILGVPERTYQRYKTNGTSLRPAQADAMLRAARVLQEANRTFGDEQKAVRWFKTVHPVLRAKPIDLIASDAGANAVGAELVRIQWGDLA